MFSFYEGSRSWLFDSSGWTTGKYFFDFETIAGKMSSTFTAIIETLAINGDSVLSLEIMVVDTSFDNRHWNSSFGYGSTILSSWWLVYIDTKALSLGLIMMIDLFMFILLVLDILFVMMMLSLSDWCIINLSFFR